MNGDPGDGGWPVASTRLDDRIVATLQGLRGRVAFSGLRRVLGVHPESLSRALRRLEREGLVERVDGGYRALGPGLPPAPATELRPIARVELPLGATAEVIESRLSGRWFGSLRWLGVVERPDGRLLAWAGRDGSGSVLLGIRDGTLRVYLTDDRPTTADDEDAAYELLGHAVSAIRVAPSAVTPVSFYRAVGASPALWSVEN